MREQLLNDLSQNLGDTLIESHLRPHEDVWLRVKTDAWQDAAMISKTPIRILWLLICNRLAHRARRKIRRHGI